MIELNLLPDVKLKYVKAERTRRLMITASVLVTAASITILILLLVVDLAQKKHLHDLSNDISSETQTLQTKPDISKILTVQNQLESLTALHSQKPAAYNLVSSYLNQVTPAKASISDITVDFNGHTMIVTGTADSLVTINQYVDTFKFTTYTTDSNSTAAPAFSNVVLSSFTLGTGSSADQSAQPASYTINLSFDPTIFNITDKVTLKVPSEVTTRSEQAQPTDLFVAQPSKDTGGN